MQITPPYGFTDIIPLTKTHRVLLPKGRTLPLAFRTMNPMPVSFTEFPSASRDYPLIFITNDNVTYTPMLVLGLAAQQNLFVSAENVWADHVYLPAYVRRYPFCMSRISVDNKLAQERIVCVEKLAINDKGDSLYDDKGTALPDWEQRQKLIFEYEADLVRTEEFCKTLAQHGLLESFTMQAIPNQGDPFQLSGMHRVSEAKLMELDPQVLKDFARNGTLGRIYAHLMSMDNFQRLLERRATHTALDTHLNS